MKFISENYQTLSPFFNQLAAVYAGMDAAYQKTATHYNFQCSGCDNNCCMTHFFHHTHLEYFYILLGIEELASIHKKNLFKKARDVNQKAMAAARQGETIRLMCPLNADNMCMIYKHRPMICRMHGIPHELKAPGRQPSFGPGCDAFHGQCGEKKLVRFNRTPFYIAMATLKKELKHSLGMTTKLKKTINQMLVD